MYTTFHNANGMWFFRETINCMIWTIMTRLWGIYWVCCANVTSNIYWMSLLTFKVSKLSEVLDQT